MSSTRRTSARTLSRKLVAQGATSRSFTNATLTGGRDRDTQETPSGESRWSTEPGDGKPVRAPNQWFFTERAWPQMRINREAWHAAQLEARTLHEELIESLRDLDAPAEALAPFGG